MSLQATRRGCIWISQDAPGPTRTSRGLRMVPPGSRCGRSWSGFEATQPRRNRDADHGFRGLRRIKQFEFLIRFNPRNPWLLHLCRCALHTFRGFDAEVAEGADHLALGDGGGGQQKRLAGGVGLVEDVMAVVEVVKLLGELEGVLGEIGGLGSRDALLDHKGEFGGEEPSLPEAVSLLAVENVADVEGSEGGGCSCCRRITFAEDIGSAHDRVLDVGAGLALEAESV